MILSLTLSLCLSLYLRLCLCLWTLSIMFTYLLYCLCLSLFSSVQFSSRWYLCAWKSPYALHPVSQMFPQRCLRNSSNVRLTDDGPLSSFQRRSSSASSFHTFLLRAIDGVMSLALCPQVVSQTAQHFRSSRTQATCEGCFARQSVCSVISLHSGMSRAVHPRHRSLRRWRSTTGTFRSGLPIRRFTFCSKFIESVRRRTCVV